MPPEIRVQHRPPREARCPYCLEALEVGDATRTCTQCGAPYHAACAEELRACAILNCEGELSRAEGWDPADLGLSERIRRALRRPHKTARPGYDPDDPDPGWAEALRARSRTRREAAALDDDSTEPDGDWTRIRRARAGAPPVAALARLGSVLSALLLGIGVGDHVPALTAVGAVLFVVSVPVLLAQRR